MGLVSDDQVTAVAISKDKQSQWAVKWAVENLLSASEPFLILVHVRVQNPVMAGNSIPNQKTEMKQLFMPFRGFCARNRVMTKEVVLDDVDVADALTAYINHNSLNNIVLGSTNRGLLQNWSKKTLPLSAILTKSAPEFCSVYVISKGKPATIRKATHSPPSTAIRPSELLSPKKESPKFAIDLGPSEELIRRCTVKESSSRRSQNTFRSPGNSVSSDSTFTSKTSSSVVSGFSVASSGAQSCDTNSSQGNSNSSDTMIEAEIRRLKMELKLTMDMYSNACKEAVTVKQKNHELQRRIHETKESEDAMLYEEAAQQVADMEKVKAQAAFEAGEAKKRLAHLKAKRKQKGAAAEGGSKEKVLNALGDIQYRKYHMEELMDATDNFSDSRKIGEGGYGPVYKASLDGMNVAIKILRSDATQGMKQFQQEVEVLSRIRHPNMVLLLGACPESGCLVYECMDNGSLEDRLFCKNGTPPLPWQMRFKMAAEIATGILFLHQTKPEPLVHRDLKPANILIDHNYVSKISDVGLARLVPPSVADTITQYHMTSAAGTFCYIDPEYQQTGMLGTKSDIYALGVVLLQIITARSPMGLAHNIEKAIKKDKFSSVLDPTVPDWPLEETLSFAKLALRCTELRKKDRPDLDTEILPELDRLRLLAYAEWSGDRDFSHWPNTTPKHSPQKPSSRTQENRTSPNARTPRKSPLGPTFSSSSRKSIEGPGSPYSGFGSSATSYNSDKSATLSDLISLDEDEEAEETDDE